MVAEACWVLVDISTAEVVAESGADNKGRN